MKEIIKEFNNYKEIEKFAKTINGEIILEPRNQESNFELVENKNSLELHYELVYDIYIMSKNKIYESGVIKANYIHKNNNEEILKDFNYLSQGDIPISDMIDEYEPMLNIKSYNNVFEEAKELIDNKPKNFINFLSIKRNSNLTFKQHALLFAKEEKFDPNKYYFKSKFITKEDEQNLIISLLSISDDEPDFKKIITRLEDYTKFNDINDDFKFILLSNIISNNLESEDLDKSISTQIFATYIGLRKNNNFDNKIFNKLDYDTLKIYDDKISNFITNEKRLKGIKVINFGISDLESEILLEQKEMKKSLTDEIHELNTKTKINFNNNKRNDYER